MASLATGVSLVANGMSIGRQSVEAASSLIDDLNALHSDFESYCGFFQEVLCAQRGLLPPALVRLPRTLHLIVGFQPSAERLVREAMHAHRSASSSRGSRARFAPQHTGWG